MSDDNCNDQRADTQPNIVPIAGASSKHEASNEIETSHYPHDPSKEKINSSQKPSWFQRFMHKHFPDAKAHDRWTLVFTAVIAFSTALYTIFAGWTLREIHSGSADTHNLALAAGKQASHTEEIAQAAQDQVDAANEISDAADSFSETADTAVEEFRDAAQQSASASQQATKNAETAITNAQESFRQEQRAWVGLERLSEFQFNEADLTGTPFTVELGLFNSGKTPALRVYTANAYKFYTFEPDEPVPTDIMALKFTPGTALPPQGRYTFVIQESPANPLSKHWAAMVAGREFFYQFGEYRYNDTAGRSHTTQFCVHLHETKTKKLAYCNGFNEMN